MTDGRPKAVLSNPRLGPFPAALRTDLERYLNQGGLLGTVTYALVYLDTGDERTAARAASVPTNLFVASCLHDDAIDAADDGAPTAGEADGNGADVNGADVNGADGNGADGTGVDRAADPKAFRNWRVTVGDVVYTRILDVVEALPAEFDTRTVTDQFRTIAYGQLDEESAPRADPTMAAAVSRVEQRGSVWGELAVSPAVAGGYGGPELDHVSTVIENILFVLTLVDDVEDVPEDLANGVANIPVLVADDDPADYPSTAAFVDSLVESDVPDRLTDVVERHEAEMEASAHRFVEASEYTPLELLDALARALEWYRESASTVTLEEAVPPERQAAIRERLAGDGAEREAVLSELLAAFPLRVREPESLVGTATEVPADRLAPVVVGLFHVSALVDSAMTTDLDAALDDLRELAASAE
jgi:hypothetical protein